MATDRNRLAEQITAIRHLQETGFSLGEGLVEGTCTSCREVVSSVLDALTQAAQSAPLIIQPDGSVGRLEEFGTTRVFNEDDEPIAGSSVVLYRIREEAPDA